MYEVNICIRCNGYEPVGQFATVEEVKAIYRYIKNNTKLIVWTACVCIDCKSQIGNDAAKQLMKGFNDEIKKEFRQGEKKIQKAEKKKHH